jgi:hypothetical protein
MRWKKWLKRIAIIAILSLLIYSLEEIGQHQWIKIRANREVAAALSETDAQDVSWHWEALIASKETMPEGENSALLTSKVSDALPRDWGKQPGEQLEWTKRLDVPSNTHYYSNVLDRIRPDRDRTDEARQLAHGLKDLKRGSPPTSIGSLSPLDEGKYSGDALRVIVLLEADTRVAIEQHADQLTSENLMALLNVARSLKAEPRLYPHILKAHIRSMVWRLTERSLALGETSSEAWKKALPLLQGAIQGDLDKPSILTAIRGERARADRFLEMVTNQSIREFAKFGNLTPGELWNPFKRLELWHYKAKIPYDRAFLLRMFNLAEKHARLPMHEQMTAFSTLPEPPRLAIEYYFSRLLRGPVDLFMRLSWQEAAEGRCAIAGIACERYRLHHGRWPKMLTELQPAFLPSIPLDPFDGQPIRYRVLDDGVVVFSTGKLTDYSGLEKHRVGLPDDIGLGFRLWDPSVRRRPAPPDPDPVPIDPN